MSIGPIQWSRLGVDPSWTKGYCWPPGKLRILFEEWETTSMKKLLRCVAKDVTTLP